MSSRADTMVPWMPEHLTEGPLEAAQEILRKFVTCSRDMNSYGMSDITLGKLLHTKGQALHKIMFTAVVEADEIISRMMYLNQD